MTKKEIRKSYLEKRRLLSDEEYHERCRKLSDMFFTTFNLSSIEVVHIFLPIEKNKEPNTLLIIDRIRREYPSVRLSIPRINPETGTIDSFFFEGVHQLKQNLWGIMEPMHGVPTPTEKIDMVIVPMLAFDRKGHRVGYGRGYYDKFLSTFKSLNIGLSLFDALEQIDDVGPHDISLQYALTPDAAYEFPAR